MHMYSLEFSIEVIESCYYISLYKDLLHVQLVRLLIERSSLLTKYLIQLEYLFIRVFYIENPTW